MPFSRTEPNVPAYKEDPNSPIDVTGQTSVTFSLSNPASNLLILSDPTTSEFNRLQVNGDTGANYGYIEEDGTRDLGNSAFVIAKGAKRGAIRLVSNANRISIISPNAVNVARKAVSGSNSAVSDPISQFTLFEQTGATADTHLRVFQIDV